MIYQTRRSFVAIVVRCVDAVFEAIRTVENIIKMKIIIVFFLDVFFFFHFKKIL
jgi:hypothetical protein